MRVFQLDVALAIRLVQPGLLNDIVLGVERNILAIDSESVSKEEVSLLLQEMKIQGLVSTYQKRRYILTPEGEKFIVMSGLRAEIDARRMFLLKETRRTIRRRGAT